MAPPGLREIIIFIVGGLTFRYFEEIMAFIQKARKKLSKVQKNSPLQLGAK